MTLAASHRSDQFALFDTAPPPVAPTARLTLPIQPRDTVDIPRVAHIFATSQTTARRIIALPDIRCFRLSATSNDWKVDYQSVVAYCDRLRVHNGIPDNRRPLTAARPRYKDSELLPFPMSDTIGTVEVMDVLQCAKRTVISLIEAGSFTAYQLLIGHRCPWRIYRPSFEGYVAGLHQAAGPRRRCFPQQV